MSAPPVAMLTCKSDPSKEKGAEGEGRMKKGDGIQLEDDDLLFSFCSNPTSPRRTFCSSVQFAILARACENTDVEEEVVSIQHRQRGRKKTGGVGRSERWDRGVLAFAVAIFQTPVPRVSGLG